jgi:hypothetical protein
MAWYCASSRGLYSMRSEFQSSAGFTQEDIRGARKPPQAIRRAQMPTRDRRHVNVRTLSIVAEKAVCRGILRRRFGRRRLDAPLQHRTHPACPGHSPASEGASPRVVTGPLGPHSIVGQRLLRRCQDDQREIGNGHDTCSAFSEAPAGSAYFDSSIAGALSPSIFVLVLLAVLRTFQVQSGKRLAARANTSTAAPATAINTTSVRFIGVGSNYVLL